MTIFKPASLFVLFLICRNQLLENILEGDILRLQSSTRCGAKSYKVITISDLQVEKDLCDLKPKTKAQSCFYK